MAQTTQWFHVRKVRFNIYSRGQKKFTFRLRRTVEKRSVPFLGTLFARSKNGQLYGKRKRKFLANRTTVISPRAARRSVYDEKTTSSRRRRSAMTYRTVPKKSSLLTRCWTAAVSSSLRIYLSTISCLR